jgi:hypothetical protein
MCSRDALRQSSGHGWPEGWFWMENLKLFLGGQHKKYGIKNRIWVPNRYLLCEWGEITEILGRNGLPQVPPYHDFEPAVWLPSTRKLEEFPTCLVALFKKAFRGILPRF